MVTLAQVINELIYPIYEWLGITLRFVGTLGVGAVAGSVLRYTLLYKFRMRFYVPLVFLGTAALFGLAVYGRWSSPGAVAGLGVGLFAGYVLLKPPQPPAEQGQAEADNA
mgnify:CR=1 FL=1